MLGVVFFSALVSFVLGLNPRCHIGYTRKVNGVEQIKFNSQLNPRCFLRTSSCKTTLRENVRKWTFNNRARNKTVWEERRLGCGLSKYCEEFAGGANSCRKTETTWSDWRPTNCIAPNYGAYEVTVSDKYYTRCCNTDECNKVTDPPFDYSTCEAGTAAAKRGQYLTDLSNCWNNVKKKFMTDLLCDEELGDIFKYTEVCTKLSGDQRIWISSHRKKRNDTVCRYRTTCTEDMRKLLKEFGECACKAAKDAGKEGSSVADLMASRWNTWCPNMKLSCSNGLLNLIRKIYRVRYKFKIAATLAQLNDTWKEKIKEYYAEKLNILKTEIKITTSTQASDTSTRRLLSGDNYATIEVNSQDDGTSAFVESQFNTDDISNAGGFQASGATAENKEVDDNIVTTTTTANPGTTKPGSAMQNGLSHLLMFVVGAIFLFWM